MEECWAQALLKVKLNFSPSQVKPTPALCLNLIPIKPYCSVPTERQRVLKMLIKGKSQVSEGSHDQVDGGEPHRTPGKRVKYSQTRHSVSVLVSDQPFI
jgi:hypothetical protein